MYEASAIIGRIKNSKCRIITEAYGQACSGAALILASGDKRRISKYAWFMYHKMSYGTSGTHDEIKDFVNQAEREQKLLIKQLSEFSNRSEEFWESKLLKKDYYLTPQQCLELELVDEVI